ncbi:MAG: alpha/beta hydrolase [Archangium sp.]|nr:alpha/beta hydrolase [Archangium sp.]
MTLFKNEQSKAAVATWFERFRQRIPHAVESRRVTTTFGETHLLVGRPPDAPPLVLLHGALASSAHVLVELAPLLERFRVYAIDVIGQSVMSADVRLSAKNDDYGRWLDEVMEQLKLDRTHVVGVSWGGFVATRLAVVAPQRIVKLALLTPAGLVSGPGWQGFVEVGWPMTMYLFFPSPKRLEKFLSGLLTTLDDREWVDFLGVAFRSYAMGGMQVPALVTPEQLQRFDAPTFILGADRDLQFPADRIAARAPSLFKQLQSVEVIKDCRHCPPTTPQFRAWLGEKLTVFLHAS